MEDIEICIGDYVLIDEIYEDEDGFEFQPCGTVIDVDKDKKQFKITSYEPAVDDETFIEVYDEEDFEDDKWYPFDKLDQIEREYKVMDITDNVDNITNEPLTVAKLSRIIKSYQRVEDGYRLSKYFSYSTFDIFILTKDSNAYKRIFYNPVENKIINFANFELGFSFANGLKQKTYYDKPEEPYYFIQENYNNK
ncbi:MAG: hypothetical protein JST50_12130 [Bacteroidetes bacterium]|jgi:hypothetical protein|nr:hypothetical protein [Bacteroidota bacterium]